MRAKRAPGAGRKPKGPYANRRASFTMRMSEDLRAGLEREAKRNGGSLSQEVERRLRESLEWPAEIQKRWGGDHHYSLGRLIARVAQNIELTTDKRWLEDAFAAQAFRAAVAIIVNRLMPSGPLQTPEMVERSASLAFIPPDQAAYYRTPEGVGSSIAHGIITDIDLNPTPPPIESGVYYSDTFYLMPRLRKGLGLAKKGDKS